MTRGMGSVSSSGDLEPGHFSDPDPRPTPEIIIVYEVHKYHYMGVDYNPFFTDPKPN